jgi:hypothetical protein
MTRQVIYITGKLTIAHFVNGDGCGSDNGEAQWNDHANFKAGDNHQQVEQSKQHQADGKGLRRNPRAFWFFQHVLPPF